MFVLHGQVKIRTENSTRTVAFAHWCFVVSNQKQNTAKKPDQVSHLHPHPNANSASREKGDVLNWKCHFSNCREIPKSLTQARADSCHAKLRDWAFLNTWKSLGRNKPHYKMLVTGLMVPAHLAEERRRSGWVLTVWSRCLESPNGLGKPTFIKAEHSFQNMQSPWRLSTASANWRWQWRSVVWQAGGRNAMLAWLWRDKVERTGFDPKKK